MSQSIGNKVISSIYGNGRGWAFTGKDFTRLGSPAAIHLALHRLEQKGTIRRVIRGLYDYPRQSSLLDQQLGPDIDQVAGALARKFGWRIQPSGATAQNLLGLSTQVPGKYVYLSDGPGRSYAVGKTSLEFEHTTLKEAGLRMRESALIVQALKSLGREGVVPEVISGIRQWLDPALRTKVLKDTQRVTGWIYDSIRKVCQEENDG